MNVNEQILQDKIDPHLNAENLSEICSKSLGKMVDVERAYILTGGCLNRVVGIELKNGSPSLVLKATPTENDKSLNHEYAALKYFINNTSMPVPSPLYYDDSRDLIPGTFYVMSKIDGVSMHHLNFSMHDIRDITEQIAEILTELHKSKNEGFGGIDKSSSDVKKKWADFWLPRFDQAIETVKNGGHVSESLLDRIALVRPSFDKLLQIGSIATLTHYDIWSGNIMLDRNNGRLKVSGLLDVQGYWADYARELSFMEMFGIANDYFYNLYQQEHRLDDTFHIRKDLYNLKMHVKHIHMYPDQIFYREGAERCLQTVENEVRNL
jgi:fructosamine-3-kinase